MPSPPPVVAVLGATGRIGRAIARYVSDNLDRSGQPASRPVLRGLARHAPADCGVWTTFIAAERHDVAAVRRLIDGADAVIDLCAFDARDADALVAAWQDCVQPPRSLVFASALAERTPAQWAAPPPDGADVEHTTTQSDDSYGAGKRAARWCYEAELSAQAASVITLLLPQILAPDDPSARELGYLADAREHGAALLPGSGSQRPCVVTADDAAAILWRCAHEPALSSGTFQVAPPVQPPLAELVRALLRGAGLAPVVQPHPDPRWRGPHSGADELVDGSALRDRLPGLAFSDLIAAHATLGQWLAKSA